MSNETSKGRDAESTSAWDDFTDVVEAALSLPERPSNRWHRSGLSRRAERALNLGGGMLLLVFAVGWLWAIVSARTLSAESPGEGSVVTRATASIAAALTRPDARSTAYLMDATVDFFAGQRGTSGKLRVAYVDEDAAVDVDSLPEGARVQYSQGDVATGAEEAPSRPGVWRPVIAAGSAMRKIADFNIVRRVPASASQRGRIGSYMVGSWPARGGPRQAPAGRYAPPSGFIEVTPQNQNTQVSQHFTFKDFLTKGQGNVWPKYLVLELRLIDKLELVIEELKKMGIPVRDVTVMSGFRTPSYNAGGGNTEGRAGMSRHMYGDAADIWVDNDGNGQMDDLNRDGKVDIDDSRVILKAVERVEQRHPELVGGTGVYRAASGHGPFIHIDTRGYRARW